MSHSASPGSTSRDLATARALEWMGCKVSDVTNRIDLLGQIWRNIRAGNKRLDLRREIAFTETIVVFKDVLEDSTAHRSTGFRTDIQTCESFIKVVAVPCRAHLTRLALFAVSGR